MKTIKLSILVLTAAMATSFGQQWEVGGMGGASFLNTVGVSGTPGSATAGFQTGGVAGAYVGYNSYKHIGGEFHYEYAMSNLKLSSGGSQATFSGGAHAVHYDVTFHTSASSERPLQLFAAVGGGLKIFRGTGTEASYQPLSQFGYFTKTQELKPMGTVSAGAKYSLSKKVFVRAEIRSYVTAFPSTLIAPAPGTKYGSVLFDFVPMVGIGVVM